MNLSLRSLTPNDYRPVEELTREAFWNLYFPGCDEHYLVHELVQHEDWLPELSFVAEIDGRLAGNIMYSRSHLQDADGGQTETLTFGPLCVHPEFQNRGVGSTLVQHSLAAAKAAGAKGVVILGFPHHYCKHGFRSSRDFHICDAEGRYPMGQLALELEPGAFTADETKRTLHLSPVYEVEPKRVAEFDQQFPAKEKAEQSSQVLFGIAIRAYLD